MMDRARDKQRDAGKYTLATTMSPAQWGIIIQVLPDQTLKNEWWLQQTEKSKRTHRSPSRSMPQNNKGGKEGNSKGSKRKNEEPGFPDSKGKGQGKYSQPSSNG